MADEPLGSVVLDATVLTECARGDLAAISLVQHLDAGKTSIIVPVLAATGAAIEVGVGEGAEVIRGLCTMESVHLVGLPHVDAAIRLAGVRRELESCDSLTDAHIAAEALIHGCPIVTMNHLRWDAVVRDLSGQITVIEVTDLTE
ncbi:hypothetical protein [Streptosporangium roseum]|uniref:hypothetical protein n=1 Tax=Streptosporangium roseum TaxID=2001 RepID=UPI003317A83F